MNCAGVRIVSSDRCTKDRSVSREGECPKDELTCKKVEHKFVQLSRLRFALFLRDMSNHDAAAATI